MNMLEHFYESSCSLRRLGQGLFWELMNSLAGRLHQLGYGRKYGQKILWTIGKFSEFVQKIGIQRPEEINKPLMRRFLDEKVSHQRALVSAALGHFWKHLRDQGIVPTGAIQTSNDPNEAILRDYGAHLADVRGLTLSSRTSSLHHARRFLTWLENRHGDGFIDRLNGVDVLEFITEFTGAHPSRSWRNDLCSYTRVFLRYLRWRGIIHADLDRVVPKLRGWRFSNVPRHLAWEDVRRLIDSADTTNALGLRDKAVMLLIATTGMRNQEVRCLQLKDIVWRTAEIRLRKTKTRRERVLPLAEETGSAIADYLLRGRPRIGTPEVFLRHFTPAGPITSTHGIGNIIEKHLRRAGIQASSRGAHLLRHSLATRMVNQSVPIKQIADMLGHTSIDTTAIYTKVDTTNLAAVALPFPGGGR
jgi:integrase/recombinase XerD